MVRAVGAVVEPDGFDGWLVLAVLPFYAIAVFAYWRRPDHPSTRRLAVMGGLFAIYAVLTPDLAAAGPGASPLAAFLANTSSTWPVYLGYHLSAVALVVVATWMFALYPAGRMETRAERRLLRPLWLALLLPPLVLVTYPRLVPPVWNVGDEQSASPFFIPSLAPVGALAVPLLQMAETLPILLGLGLLVVRYRRSPLERRQRIKWLFIPLGLAAFLLAVRLLLATLALGTGDQLDGLEVLLVPTVAVSLLVGLRQQRIIDVEIVLRRSLVYGVLWLLIAAAYVAAAAALGVAASARFPVLVAILLTIAVTLGFQPARRWLDRAADRWVFGERLGRYEALTRLGAVLEEANEPEGLLPQLAATVRRALGLAWSRVTIKTGAGLDGATVGGDGAPGDELPALEVPITLAGERLGTLQCGPKLAGSFTAADTELLADLARQAALAIRNVRLATELSARVEQLRRQSAELAESRRRLVRAQESERRRIERNLHDGIQQDLVALIGEVGRGRSRLDGDPSLTGPLLEELQLELTRILHDLRELARGIHPQVLTDRGLLEAVETRAGRAPIPVIVRASPALRGARFAPEVEGAAYFAVCEALANTLKHAQARHGEVRLELRDGMLLLDVADDGRGSVNQGGNGSGLANLAERLNALGGSFTVTGSPDGTTVHGQLPADAREAPNG